MNDPKLNGLMRAHGGFEILEDGFRVGMPEVHVLPPDGVYVVRRVFDPNGTYVGMEYMTAVPIERRVQWTYVDRDEDDSRFDECEPLIGLGGPWMDYELSFEEWTDEGIKGLLEQEKKGTLKAPYQHLVDEAHARKWVPGMNGNKVAKP